MLYDMDKRAEVKGLTALMQFEMPFVSIMPDEYEYRPNDVRFIYSDLGISADKLRKLMDLTVRKDGFDRKFAYVTVWVEETGEAEFSSLYDQDMPVMIKHTVAVFE